MYNPLPKVLRLMSLLLGVASCGTLAACGSDRRANDQNLYALLKTVWGNERVTLKQAAAIPYATIGLRVGGSSQVIVTLATDTGQQRVWMLGEKIAIVTYASGQIQRTVGLEHDLTWSASLQSNGAGASLHKAQRTWSVDFADLKIFSALISCHEAIAGKAQIVILGRPIMTTRVIQRCECPQLHWTFTNTYWNDTETGIAWRSIQYIHPKMDPVEIEVLRPPS